MARPYPVVPLDSTVPAQLIGPVGPVGPVDSGVRVVRAVFTEPVASMVRLVPEVRLGLLPEVRVDSPQAVFARPVAEAEVPVAEAVVVAASTVVAVAVVVSTAAAAAVIVERDRRSEKTPNNTSGGLARWGYVQKCASPRIDNTPASSIKLYRVNQDLQA
jgi:hypothetical protein